MDRDLQSMQEMRTLVRQAAVAQAALAALNQEQVDRICAAVAQAGFAASAELARIAVEDTGMGTIPGKTVKNQFNTKDLWEAIKDMKTVGIVVRDEARRVYEIAEPSGVVCGIIPCTNPTSTALFKSLIALKTRNALVISPHPRAVKCIQATVEVIMRAASAAGAPAGAVSSLSMPMIEVTQELMKHPDVAVILATGGSALVRAAYSAGKPAYGVGPGNVPVYIDKSANIPEAVANIIAGGTFDNGTVCASEQAVVTLQSVRQQVIDEFRKQGGYFASPEEIQKLNPVCCSGAIMNPGAVGLSAVRIAQMAGIAVPPTTCVLLAELEGVGRKWPLSMEKLMPVLAFYAEPSFEAALARCVEVLHYEGEGHSCAIHTADEQQIQTFAQTCPSNRVMVNTPTTHGAIGLTTGLFPSMSLGCGPVAGNITSDNIQPRHLISIKRLAYGKSAASVEGKYGAPVAASVQAPPAPASGAYPWAQAGGDFPRFYSPLATPLGDREAAAAPRPAVVAAASVALTADDIRLILAAVRVAPRTHHCPVTSCPENLKASCTGCT